MFSGDKTILEQQIDSMKAWVDYIRKVDGEHHGWRNSFHYGDWLALDRPGAKEGNVYGATDEAYIADVYYAASAQIVAKVAEVLGKSELQKEYQEIADQLQVSLSTVQKELKLIMAICVGVAERLDQP